MATILAGFFELLGVPVNAGRCALCPDNDRAIGAAHVLEEHGYEALLALIEFDDRFATEWMRYTHELFPIAPPGFHWIGRHANAPRQLLGIDLSRILVVNPFPELELGDGL